MSDYLLELKDIVRTFQVGNEELTVLKGVSLAVKQGEFLAILGPSGSGKSTLMNTIGLLDVPTSGEYWLDGKLLAGASETELARLRNQKIGFIFQSYFLMPKMTAKENVKLPLFYANMLENEQEKRACEMLEKVGLGDRMDFYPSQLSGGLQQRVAIARALSTNPDILLADEPTGALDQKTGKQIIELFHKLNEEGTTIIMITHDASIASHASRIVKILDGNISDGELADA